MKVVMLEHILSHYLTQQPEVVAQPLNVSRAQAQLLQLLSDVQYRSSQILTLKNLGWAYLKAEQPQQAIALFDQGTASLSETLLTKEIGLVAELALGYATAGRNDTALKLLSTYRLSTYRSQINPFTSDDLIDWIEYPRMLVQISGHAKTIAYPFF